MAQPEMSEQPEMAAPVTTVGRALLAATDVSIRLEELRDDIRDNRYDLPQPLLRALLRELEAIVEQAEVVYSANSWYGFLFCSKGQIGFDMKPTKRYV